MKIVRQLAVGALCAVWAIAASGQAYPNKPVKLVVPFTAGSATDILARTVGQKLSETWGQPVIVDNRPGAGGTIGTAIVAKAPPDGYTLLVHSAAHAYNPSIYPNLSYDTVKDFVDVTPLAGQPNVLVVAPASGFKTVADLIARRRRSPARSISARPAPAAARTSTPRNSGSRPASTSCTFRTRARRKR